ncbi:MAG: hypothetical protein JWN89_485 [Parcubacteria group bacterium]|nr:hypothetical protein [Parcubacteria group bacterium]
MGRKASSLVSHKDFVPSLRLLIEEEQYSLHDIGLIFDRTREWARQQCNKHGINPHDRLRGLRAVRVWDDANNRFRPMSRFSIWTREWASRVEEFQAQGFSARHTKRALIAAEVLAVQKELGRSLTSGELVEFLRAHNFFYLELCPS